MPIHKTRWSAREIRDRRFYLELLRDEGLDVGEELESIAERQEACPLEISQSDFGDACQLRTGEVAYGIPLRIVALGSTTVTDLAIASPWDDTVDMPDLRERAGHYKFGSLRYLVDEVLNDRFARPVHMKRGSIMEGIVIAQGFVPVPAEFNNPVVPVEISAIDSLQRRMRSTIKLQLSRANLKKAPVPVAPPLQGKDLALENVRSSTAEEVEHLSMAELAEIDFQSRQ